MRTSIYGPALSLPAQVAKADGSVFLENAPFGAALRAFAVGMRKREGVGIFVARDDRQAAAALELLSFFAPDLDRQSFPAWDCPPYDRVSPSPAIASQRCLVLSRLARRTAADTTLVLVTTGAAIAQRLPPLAIMRAAGLQANQGQTIALAQINTFLETNGFSRASTVREPGEYAIRGGLIDIFVTTDHGPIRLDFFGDHLESIRAFDPETQRTQRTLTSVELTPVSEVLFSEDTLARLRSNYLARFGIPNGDAMYEAARGRIRRQGLEHWLPLFYPELEDLTAYVGDDCLWMLDPLALSSASARFQQAEENHSARVEALGGDTQSAKLVSPSELLLDQSQLRGLLALRHVLWMEDRPDLIARIDIKAHNPRDFAPERVNPTINLFEAAAEHVRTLKENKQRVVFAAWSEGSADRLSNLLEDHGLGKLSIASTADQIESHDICIAVLAIEHGWTEVDLAVLTETDLLGDKMSRVRRTRRASNFITEAGSLSVGDLIVHVDHGVGRFAGLKTVEANGAPHDCLEIMYAGGDKLFLPVENIELVSRYGGENEDSVLDRLGGAAWQNRKARAKRRIRELAAGLIELAAARMTRKGSVIAAPEGLYEEFCARFPYEETDDQLRSISDVLGDLTSGRPMDRLICGDVGFGKTEVAFRAAFVAAMSGQQVVVIAPTTLLAQQHYRTFSERLAHWPIVTRPLSRFVSASDARATKEGLKTGQIDVVVGTHALLSKDIEFKRLGLLVIDEEQRFGVKHKERLKELKTDVHVLTMSATPIPRTLQMALSGIRDLSIIATPPVDRLAIRTYVVEQDEVTLREALLRERFRGGQSFFVAPRVSDLPDLEAFLRTRVPEVSFVTAHGQMPTQVLEDVVGDFYEGKYDVLLATTIVEAGLDIPRANTLIVHRADMFGLAQLYQLRGRVGRAKVRAYAYLTTPDADLITESAEKRLRVLRSLDSLGAGFQIASHDLDMRGGGNLLGEEQSGQIREVGVELYQSMLEEAVAALREGGADVQDDWSPQINIGATVLIPESYVEDLNLRLSLYRRLGDITEEQEREAFAAEIIDRFGPMPDEVRQLLDVAAIRSTCKMLGIARIDAGPKGGVFSFRDNARIDPAKLVEFVSRRAGTLRLRPDFKLAATQEWSEVRVRGRGVRAILKELNDLAA